MTSDTSTRRHAKRRRAGLPAAAGALVVAGWVVVIPFDRQRIVGDNVVGPSSATVSGMPWDPADGWDREHFMARSARPRRAGTGSAHRFRGDRPGFDRNKQTSLLR